ncbi:MAG: hypothetical protein ACR2QG_08000 [Gammaproteobacteria bacterium]
MERLIKVASLFVMAMFLSPANAQTSDQISDQDCQSILEAYAVAPKTVAPDVVRACEEILAANPALNATASAVDCTQPGSGSSVQCWGPWASLAPAAAGIVPGSDSIIEPDERDLLDGPLLADGGGPGPGPDPDIPVGACAAGQASCGYSATVAGIAPPTGATATIQSFDLATDGTSFTVDADGTPINSLQLSPVYVLNPATGLYNTVANSIGPGGQFSGQAARSLCDGPCVTGGPNEVLISADIWQNIDAGGNATNGVYGWGRAISQVELDDFINNNIVLDFAGPMSLDNNINAQLSLDYGSLTWDGSFTNTLTASDLFSINDGSISGPNFLATPDSFSAEVINPASAITQGTVVGQDPDLAALIVVDVELQGGAYKDVGALGVQ